MSVEAITLRNQMASPLLRLPREIRDRIYHFALLYDGVVNIYPAQNSVDFCTESHSIYGCARKKSPHQRPRDMRPDIPLRSTCRQINHEARYVYFACNIFAFVNSIDFNGRDVYTDLHFKVPEMNEIKTVQVTVKNCLAVVTSDGPSKFARLRSVRFDDLKGMQKVSKIYVRIHQSRIIGNAFPVHRLHAGVATPHPFFTAPPKPLKPEVVLETLRDEFEAAGYRKATIHLVQEEKQERDPLKKVHGIRQWLDI